MNDDVQSFEKIDIILEWSIEETIHKTLKKDIKHSNAKKPLIIDDFKVFERTESKPMKEHISEEVEERSGMKSF
jgi:hypothetical protein